MSTVESGGSNGGAEEPLPLVVDDAPAYDGLISLRAVAQPSSLRRGPWREWAKATSNTLQVEQWRRLRRWFAETTFGDALVALIPLLTGARDLAELARALEAAPLADVMRVAVAAEFIDPQTPLEADDLLALRGDPLAAQRFCDRYLRVRGRQRAVMTRLLVAPEAARAEWLVMLREHDAGVFAALEPQLAPERERAVAALRAQIARDGGKAPAFILERDHLRGFSPIIIGTSALLGDTQCLYYYHDIDRTLVDGRAYEPFIAIAGTQLALGLARRRRGGAEGADRAIDPAIRWAAVYAALADPSRLRILRLLAERPRYGQELAAELGVSGATVSHHLSALSKAGILSIERQAHRTYCVLDRATLRALLRRGEGFALSEPAADDTDADIDGDSADEGARDAHTGMA